MCREIYLDNNATTEPLPAVAHAVVKSLGVSFGNPSSPHARGRLARKSLEAARSAVAELIRRPPESIMFCSGATEGNNAVLRDASREGRVIISSSAEHPSVDEVADSAGSTVRVGLDADGVVDLARFRQALSDYPVSMVALHWVNGETGVIQPVEEICELARLQGALTLLDGAQAIGRLSPEDIRPSYDFLSFSSHKLHGPQGVGALCFGGEARVSPLILGGGQENGLRSGTENLPGIIGFGVACQDRCGNLDVHLSKLSAMRDAFESALAEKLDGVRVNGVNAPRVPNTSNVTFLGVDGQALAARLDAANVICSQVSACSSARPSPSKTLLAMGVSEEEAFASLRFSFSVLNSLSEALEAAEIVAGEVSFLRKVMGCVS